MRSMSTTEVLFSFLKRRFYFNRRQITVREALNSALDEELARDKDVFIMGEEVNISQTP